MDDDMIGREPHPLAVSSQTPPNGISRGELMVQDGCHPPSGMGPPQDTPGLMGSPIRSSPIAEERDPIAA